MQNLIEKGILKIEWTDQFMKILAEIRKRWEKEKPLKGIKVAATLHVEAKTAVLIKTLVTAGAEVSLAACNPETTQDDVAKALSKYAKVYAKRGMTEKEYWDAIRKVIEFEPDIIIDDGGDTHSLIHAEYPDLAKKVIGGTEETTTGVIRLHAMQKEKILKYPVVLVNEAKMKYLFDNRYGTGQSTIFGIMNATNLSISGKTVVVCGYGWCGKGIAKMARAMGANVIICEVDPIKAAEAVMDGFRVMKLIDAVREADFVITATGNKKVVRKEHFLAAKDGCIFANAGHFNVEVWIPDLKELAIEHKKTRYFGLPYNDYLVEEFILKDGKRLYLLGKGRLVNLVCGQGHPVEVMDLSFSLQALSVEWLVKNGHSLEPKLYYVPREIDEYIARLFLKTRGIEIDKLTEEQKQYLASWKLD